MCSFVHKNDSVSTIGGSPFYGTKVITETSHGTIRVPADFMVRDGKRGVSGYHMSGITPG